MSESDFRRLWDFMMQHQETEYSNQKELRAELADFKSSIFTRLSDLELKVAQVQGGWKAVTVMSCVIVTVACGLAWVWVYIVPHLQPIPVH